MSIPDLREALLERGLDSSGLKTVLQNRLREAIFQNDSSQSNESNVTGIVINSDPSLDDKNELLTLMKIPKGPVYKRIPKASRLQACIAFTKVIQNVTYKNDIKSWQDLLSFAKCAIGGSVRGGKRRKAKQQF